MTHKKRKPSSTPSKLKDMQATDFADNFKKVLKDPEVQELLGEAIGGVVNELIKENEILTKRVNELEFRLQNQEQYSRRNCAVVTGIPEPKDGKENTDDIILKLAKDMGMDLKPCDISRSHRLRSRRNKAPRDIVFRFVSYNKRAQFFKSKKSLREKEKYKSVYVQEHLTTQRAGVFYEARRLRKEGAIENTWTYDGRICVKIKDSIHQVTTCDQLTDVVFEKVKRKKAVVKNRSRHPIQDSFVACAKGTSDTEALSTSESEQDDVEENMDKTSVGITGDTK